MARRAPEPPASATAPGPLVAGVDEAGRGCLAGPVAAAAVILDPRRPIAGLADSKSLSASKREALAAEIKAKALAWGLGLSWQRRIDEINILQATFEAMGKAARSLKIQPSLLLIDGPHRVPSPALGLPIPQKAIVRGDQSEPCISAASILAKCFRDLLMSRLDRKWPAYGFARHKGYGVPAHLAALREHGPCPLHRMSFRRVRPGPEALPRMGTRPQPAP